MNMLKLTISRPNTIGTTFEREYDSYNDAEDFIERKVEKLADDDWEVTELKGSNSKAGTIEATHDNVADSVIIEWTTIDTI